jgi:hypothetical protein
MRIRETATADGMDLSDSANPPFTGTDPNGATVSGDGDDQDYYETETNIDPELGEPAIPVVTVCTPLPATRAKT